MKSKERFQRVAIPLIALLICATALGMTLRATTTTRAASTAARMFFGDKAVDLASHQCQSLLLPEKT